MRLLISASRRNTNTLGSFIIQNFEPSLVYEVLDFPDRFAELMELKFYRLIYRLFPILIVRSMDRLFLAQAARFNPTVVLIFKGMEISKWSLQRLSAKGIKLVNYNLDHPFEFFSRGSGNRFVREAIPNYDLHITYSLQIQKQLEDIYKIKTALIPFGFQVTEELYDKIWAEPEAEINRICFIGNPDKIRTRTIQLLLSNGLAVDVYGYNWKKYLSPHINLKVFDQVQGEDYWRTIVKYRAQLNIFRPHNVNSHNMRTFEVPAAGGILLTPDNQEQRSFFKSEEEVFFYTSDDSLIAQCKKLCRMEAIEVNRIRYSARETSIKADYSYARRTKDLLAVLEKLILVKS